MAEEPGRPGAAPTTPGIGDSRPATSDDALRFAERFLALLDGGRFTASYKFAVLTALIDTCVEGVDGDGRAPSVVSAKDLGRKVLELYWRQAQPYRVDDDERRYLRQSTQASDVVVRIARFREQAGLRAGASIEVARRVDASGFAMLERHVLTTVIRMPLPKLQRVSTGPGAGEDRFLYDFGWPDEVAESLVWAADFDDALHLRPGVGEWLVRMAGLLRPIVQQRWAAFVADRSREVVEAAYLDEFLFGSDRISLSSVRDPLAELQDGRCFYCAGPLGTSAAACEVDHFVPWARHPDNGIHNLVAAHRRCNNAKRESLAAVDHLIRWVERPLTTLESVAAATGWLSDAPRTTSAVRASYLWLPDDAWLWRAPGDYERADNGRIRRLLLG